MTIVYYFIFVSVVQLSHCVENNVCQTLQDYYTIKNNDNCEYDVAADPDADPVTVITFHGYPAETHKVITLDGYILTLFRIPNNEVTSKRGPVFLQHGWMSSGVTFLGLGKHSLPFILADAGYDVWLGNFRGTQYSEEHVNLTVYNKEYWDYSFDEIGLYDLPAQLDYVSHATGNKGDIVYIGHSLGTLVSSIYSSTFPEHAKRTLKLFILLTPITQPLRPKAPLFLFLLAAIKPIEKIIMNNDLIRIVSHFKVLNSLRRQICFESPLLLQRCLQLVNVLIAGPKNQIAPKTLPVFFNQLPAGSSFKVLSHAAQLMKGGFRRYDYGVRNFEKYGSYEPPPYELKKIEVPVFVAYAINDWAITPEDALTAYNNLSRKVRYGKYEIKVPNFNHLDFLYGKNAKSIIYDVVLEVMNGVE